jgi:hypothetical protein
MVERRTIADAAGARLCSWRQDSTSCCPADKMQIPALGREASFGVVVGYWLR